MKLTDPKEIAELVKNNVLELIIYSKEEITEASKFWTVEELAELHSSAASMEEQYNTAQMVAKIIMNSLYGALGNAYFPLFNEAIAQAITGNGRYFIRKLAEYIEQKLQSLHKSEKPYIVYGDTDSCVGSTVIRSSKGVKRIELMYSSLIGDVEVRGKDNFIKHLKEVVYTNSVNDKKELESKKINYIMKHKVKKRMFKIKHSEDEVIVTEDHSIIILRNDLIISVKPKNIIKSDKIIKIADELIKTHENFTIEDLGICEEWVYDIEVEDNHNFFGNNILVHNSVYYHIEPFMESYITNNPDKTMDHYVDVADNFEKKIIAPVVQQCIDDFSKELNSYNKSVISSDREIIADSAVFCAKKAYFARVRDNEGTRYPEDSPKIKVTGMDVAKSGTPKWSKKKLKEAIPKILDLSEPELKSWLRDIKKEYKIAPLYDICNIGGVNNLEYVLGEKSVPIGARSALIYNKYIADNKIDDIHQKIMAGDKTKRLHLRTPNKFNSNIVAFTSDNFTGVIDRSEVDLDKQYEKTFLNLLNLMTKGLNYKIFQETTEIDDW